MVEICKAFVTGHPIKHSRSPLIHGFWLNEHQINGAYQPIDVLPADFSDFVAGLQKNGFVGGNVTLPHKEAAFAACDQYDAEAQAIGAVNTLWFENDRLCGGNTDSYGFSANLDAYAQGWDNADTALVLGAGGASRAIIHALKMRGFTHIHVVNRTRARAQELADYFVHGVSAHGWDDADRLVERAGLIVNTTSLGMIGHGDSEPFPLNLQKADPRTIATDIVYVPLETAFLTKAKAQGLRTVDGLGMLLHQAVPGFEHWFGIRPQVTPALRALILDDMAQKMDA